MGSGNSGYRVSCQTGKRWKYSEELFKLYGLLILPTLTFWDFLQANLLVDISHTIDQSVDNDQMWTTAFDKWLDFDKWLVNLKSQTFKVFQETVPNYILCKITKAKNIPLLDTNTKSAVFYTTLLVKYYIQICSES